MVLVFLSYSYKDLEKAQLKIHNGKEWEYTQASFYIAANKSVVDAFQSILDAHLRKA